MTYDSTVAFAPTFQQLRDRFPTINLNDPRLSTFFVTPPTSYQLAPYQRSDLKSPNDSGYVSRRPSQKSEKPADTTWQRAEKFDLEMPRPIDDTRPLHIQRYTHSSRCSANRVPGEMPNQVEGSKSRHVKRYTHSSRCTVNPSFNPTDYWLTGNEILFKTKGDATTDISYIPCEVLAHANPIGNESDSQGSDLSRHQSGRDQPLLDASDFKAKKGIEDISVDDFRRKSKRTLKQVSKTLPLRVT